MMDVVAELALHLAELQRKLDVNDVEAQEMKQRLQETEGRLKETEGRLKATERHIKRQQTNWKRTGLTLDRIDALKSRRQRGEGSGRFKDQDGVEMRFLDSLH
jgi:predicted nuclease with TOPRIM domain